MPEEAFIYLKSRFRTVWNQGQLTERQLIKRVGRFNGLLTTLSDPISKPVIDAAHRLEGIANCAVGFNNIDLKAAAARGIPVSNTPGVLTESTADLAWALLLSCARRIPEGERLVRSGRFKGADLLMLRGLDLKGKTLGIYGCGRIGQAVARRGRGWDMKVIYHNRHRLDPAAEGRIHARYGTFPRLLKLSDYLVVTAPLNDNTRGRFGLREFRKMRRTAVFINIGRGSIHREKELAMALQRGYIAYAGLDVYEREPDVEKTLLRSDKVTLSPHIGSASVQTRRTMALLAARNLERMLNGKKPLNPVAPL